MVEGGEQLRFALEAGEAPMPPAPIAETIP
jgi:hypothetical protein